MIEVVSIFEDVSKDSVVIEQNGNITMPMFNRMSRRAELRLIDWLSGDPAGQLPPEPWTTQKNKDFLSPFMDKTDKSVVGGLITRPDNYYRFEDLYRIGSKTDSGCCDEDSDKYCDDEKPVDDKKTTIELLDSAQFNNRVNSWVVGDRPTMKNPIAKQFARAFEFYPKDLGQVTLEYIRYPKFGSIKSTPDPVYNDEIPTAVNNYEWDEWAREPLVWFITDLFANRVSNKAMKEFNSATKKTVRE